MALGRRAQTDHIFLNFLGYSIEDFAMQYGTIKVLHGSSWYVQMTHLDTSTAEMQMAGTEDRRHGAPGFEGLECCLERGLDEQCRKALKLPDAQDMKMMPAAQKDSSGMKSGSSFVIVLTCEMQPLRTPFYVAYPDARKQEAVVNILEW